MSNLYKIEGENEFAYFKANFNQLRQIFESDANWVAGVMEIAQHYGLTKGMQKFRNSLWGCKIEEQGTIILRCVERSVSITESRRLAKRFHG